MNLKPKACLNCPGSGDFKTYGFIPSDITVTEVTREMIQKKKMVVMAESGGETEALRSIPLCGATGTQLEERIFKPLGLKREDIIIDNLIRCRPHKNNFPTGDTARDMIQSCRMWDTIIDLYNPNVIILAFHPTFSLIYTTQAYSAYNAINKALGLKRKGYRPLVAMGQKIMEAFLGGLPGSITDWDGKHFFVSWQPRGIKSIEQYEMALNNRQEPKKVKIRLQSLKSSTRRRRR